VDFELVSAITEIVTNRRGAGHPRSR